MRNIKITVEYDGTNFCGWQVQDCRSASSIQEIIEKALRKILQEKIKVIGSGRTDSGVHARAQVANFKTASKLGCQNIQKALNSTLPRRIRIQEARDVHPKFHARFSAKAKLYRYSVVNDSFVSPFLSAYCHLVKYPLDVARMGRAAKFLLGKRDFSSFQAADKKERHPVRTIKRLEIRKKGSLICFYIEANGFLYRMARNIVGTLIDVGRGRLNPRDIQAILKAKNRRYAGPCAPAKGLCLMEVYYKH